MLHELTHYYNWSKGIQDCSRGNTYHSKKFKVEAEKHGLVIEYDPRIGWSLTSATEELVNWIIENDLEDFRLDVTNTLLYLVLVAVLAVEVQHQ